MSILLISVQKDFDVIGLKSLHAALLAGNIDSSLLFLPEINTSGSAFLNALAGFLGDHSFSVAGISLMSTEFFTAAAVTDALRQCTDIPIIWGGIHPTIAPGECLQHADFVCRGEGERVIADIAGALERGADLKTVNNLCYLDPDSGAVVKNPLYPYIEDLDSLPVAAHFPSESYIFTGGSIRPLTLDLFRIYSRYRGTSYSIMTSRGCPFSCTYCCNNFFFTLYGSKKVRRRNSSHVIAELEKAVSEHAYISLINFQDDAFLSAPAETIREFCDLYRSRIGRPFVVRCIPNSVTREKLQMLRDAGLSWISLGLQSGSDRVCRDIYRRKSTKAAFLAAAAVISELKIAAFYDVILDNPFEQDQDLLETAYTLLLTPRPFYAQFYSLTLYLGTELHTMAAQRCPENLGDYHTKEYLAYDPRNILNHLIRISSYAGRGIASRLLMLYKTDPSGMRFAILYRILRVMSLVLYEPAAYLRILLRAHRGSVVSLARQIPSLFGDMLARYRLQFRRDS